MVIEVIERFNEILSSKFSRIRGKILRRRNSFVFIRNSNFQGTIPDYNRYVEEHFFDSLKRRYQIFHQTFHQFSSILVSNSCNVIRNYANPIPRLLNSQCQLAIVVNKFLRNNRNVAINFSGIQQRVFQRQLRSLGRFERPGPGRVSARCEGHLLGVSLILLECNINKLFCGKKNIAIKILSKFTFDERNVFANFLN